MRRWSYPLLGGDADRDASGKNIIEFARGERPITERMASILEFVFGPITYGLLSLQSFYDLEMWVWEIELLFNTRKKLHRFSGQDSWAVSNDEAAALADVKDIIRTTVSEKRARIMRQIRTRRRLR